MKGCIGRIFDDPLRPGFDSSSTRCTMTFQSQDHIEEKPCVMLGKRVCKKTRLAVEHVLNEW